MQVVDSVLIRPQDKPPLAVSILCIPLRVDGKWIHRAMFDGVGGLNTQVVQNGLLPLNIFPFFSLQKICRARDDVTFPNEHSHPLAVREHSEEETSHHNSPSSHQHTVVLPEPVWGRLMQSAYCFVYLELKWPSRDPKMWQLHSVIMAALSSLPL